MRWGARGLSRDRRPLRRPRRRELELAATGPRRSVGGFDQLDTQHGIARLAPDPLAARDRLLEVLLEVTEPLGVRRVQQDFKQAITRGEWIGREARDAV